MKGAEPFDLTSPARPASGKAFTLVEVVLALGIIGVSLLAVIGLLPTGLNSQQAAQDEARAVSGLNMVSSATESLRFTGRSSGNATWFFPSYFADDPANPKNIYVTQATWAFTFFLDETGLIIPATDTTTTKRQTLFVRVTPPQIEGQPVKLYAAVAWPYRSTDSSTTPPAQMAGRHGFLECAIAYTPRSTQ
jgi:uncharacterized protein (TIGR02598 family)